MSAASVSRWAGPIREAAAEKVVHVRRASGRAQQIGQTVVIAQRPFRRVAPVQIADGGVARRMQRIVHLVVVAVDVADAEQAHWAIAIVDEGVGQAAAGAKPTESPGRNRCSAPSSQTSGSPSSTWTNSSSVFRVRPAGALARLQQFMMDAEAGEAVMLASAAPRASGSWRRDSFANRARSARSSV